MEKILIFISLGLSLISLSISLFVFLKQKNQSILDINTKVKTSNGKLVGLFDVEKSN